jgi:hypothetical protein
VDFRWTVLRRRIFVGQSYDAGYEIDTNETPISFANLKIYKTAFDSCRVCRLSKPSVLQGQLRPRESRTRSCLPLQWTVSNKPLRFQQYPLLGIQLLQGILNSEVLFSRCSLRFNVSEGHLMGPSMSLCMCLCRDFQPIWCCHLSVVLETNIITRERLIGFSRSFVWELCHERLVQTHTS